MPRNTNTNTKVQKKEEIAKAKAPVNRFSVLDMSSDSEEEVQEIQEVKKPIVQVQQTSLPEWRADAYHNKKNKKWKMGAKDKEGWTSITWTKPQFVDDDEEQAIKREMLEEIAEAEAIVESVQKQHVSIEKEVEEEGDMLKEPEEDTVEEKEKKDQASAMMWAEKIRATLEKAEMAKKGSASGLSDDFVASLGKLSFFRRGT